MKIKLRYSVSLIALQLALGLGAAEAIQFSWDDGYEGAANIAATRYGGAITSEGMAEMVATKEVVEGYKTAHGALTPGQTKAIVELQAMDPKTWDQVAIHGLPVGHLGGAAELMKANPFRPLTPAELTDYTGAGPIGAHPVADVQAAKVCLRTLGLNSAGGVGMPVETYLYLKTGTTAVAGPAPAPAVFTPRPNPMPEEIETTHILRMDGTAAVVTDKPLDVAIATALAQWKDFKDLKGAICTTTTHQHLTNYAAMKAFPDFDQNISVEEVEAYQAMQAAVGAAGGVAAVPTCVSQIRAWLKMITPKANGGLEIARVNVNNMDQVNASMKLEALELQEVDINLINAMVYAQPAGGGVPLITDDEFKNGIGESLLLSAAEYLRKGVPVAGLTRPQIEALASLEKDEERNALIGIVGAMPAFDPTGNMDLVKTVAPFTGPGITAYVQTLAAERELLTTPAIFAAGTVVVGARAAILALAGGTPIADLPGAQAAANAVGAGADAAAVQAVRDTIVQRREGICSAEELGLTEPRVYDGAQAVSKLGLKLDEKNTHAAAILLEANLRAGAALITVGTMTQLQLNAAKEFVDIDAGTGNPLTQEILDGLLYIRDPANAHSRQAKKLTMDTLNSIVELHQQRAAIAGLQTPQWLVFMFEKAPAAGAVADLTKQNILDAIVGLNIVDPLQKEINTWINPIANNAFVLLAASRAAAGGGAAAAVATLGAAVQPTAQKINDYRAWLVDDIAGGNRL